MKQKRYAYLVLVQRRTYRNSSGPISVERKLQIYNNHENRRWTDETGYKVLSVHATRESAIMAVKEAESKDFNEVNSLIPKKEFTYGVYAIRQRVIHQLLS